MTERFKGRHHLRRYDNGLEKCIGCALCAAACPADAIFVEASENTDEVRFSPGERYASTYEINMMRCIYCGYCEDACPTAGDRTGSRLRDWPTPTSAIRSITRGDAAGRRRRKAATPPRSKVEPGKFNRSIPVMKDPE